MKPTATLFAPDMERSATIDPTGRYRYDLGRRWADGPTVNFVMLNPSTADARADDPTVRRCIGFAGAWDFGGLVVTNLFAFRATHPRDLAAGLDPIGPENDAHLARWARAADLVVCAWGCHRGLHGREHDVLDLLVSAGARPHALALTDRGHPAHPLYLPGSLVPRPMP